MITNLRFIIYKVSPARSGEPRLTTGGRNLVVGTSGGNLVVRHALSKNTWARGTGGVFFHSGRFFRSRSGKHPLESVKYEHHKICGEQYLPV